MAKSTFFLIAVLAVLVNVSLSGPAGRLRSEHGGGGKCSMIMGFLPNPKCGHCGRQAGVNKWNQDSYKRRKYHHKRSTEENASNIAPDKYIYAGEATGIAQYPWLVRVTVTLYTKIKRVCYDQGEGRKLCQPEEVTGLTACGGSLVSSRHVITAAHCFDRPTVTVTNDEVWITLAEYNTKTYPKDCVGSKCVDNLALHPDKIHIHRGYVFERGTYYNDIAMLTLKDSAPYTDYIRPICLPSFNVSVPWFENAPLTIAGWGLTESKSASPIKQHTQVRMVAPETCRFYYPLLTEGMLCAIGKSGQDVCYGDSGGPIMWEHEGVFFLIGVVSAKAGDCGSSVPAKYTNVFSYMSWIENIMKG